MRYYFNPLQNESAYTFFALALSITALTIAIAALWRVML